MTDRIEELDGIHLDAELDALLNIGTRLGYELEDVSLHPQTLLTDASVAHQFAEDCQDVLRSVPEQGAWLVWSGHHWERDVTGQVDEHVKAYAHYVFTKYATAEDKVKRLAKSFLSRGKINAVKSLAETERPLVVRVDRLDTAEHRLATPSGTINLRTGRLEEPNPHDLITKVTKATYAPGLTWREEAPRWAKFLDEVTNGDKELQAYLQRTAGYCITGSTKEQLIWILHGEGSNGKDTYLNALSYALGDYIGSGAPVLLVYDKHQKHPTEIADLQGLRMAIHSEMERNQKMAEAKVKLLTGSTRLKARRLYQDFMEFPNTAKHVLTTNHLPTIQGDDYAMARRLVVVPFTRRFEGEERDRDLEKKLQRESTGILAWAVEGARLWYEEEQLPTAPAVVRTATNNYLEDNDPLALFLDGHLDITSSPQDWTSTEDLRLALLKWEHGDMAALYKGSTHPLESSLWARLKREGCESKQKNVTKEDGKRTKKRGWTGVKVKP